MRPPARRRGRRPRGRHESGGRRRARLAELRREGAGGLSGVDYATFDFPRSPSRGSDCGKGLRRPPRRDRDPDRDRGVPRHDAESLLSRGVHTRGRSGFVGALAMLEEPTIPREVPIVGLECSAARGGNAIVGDGPIVCVGDRIATFDPGVSAFLRDCAEALAADGSGFRYQRKLMQGERASRPPTSSTAAAPAPFAWHWAITTIFPTPAPTTPRPASPPSTCRGATSRRSRASSRRRWSARPCSPIPGCQRKHRWRSAWKSGVRGSDDTAPSNTAPSDAAARSDSGGSPSPRG